MPLADISYGKVSKSDFKTNKSKFNPMVIERKLFPWLLLATYLLVLPIPGTTALRNLMFYPLLGVTFYGYWQRKNSVSFDFPLLLSAWAVYAAVALISVLFAIDVRYSLDEFRLEVVYAFLSILIGYYWGEAVRGVERILATLTMANALICLVGMAGLALALHQDGWQHVFPEIPFAPGNFTVGKFPSYVLTILPFVAVYLLVLKPTKHPKFFVLLLMLNLVLVLATQNRMFFLAVLVGGLLFCLLVWQDPRCRPSRKNALLSILLLAGIVIAAAVVVVQKRGVEIDSLHQQDPRIKIWQKVVHLVEEQPWIGGGIGIEAFRKRVPDWRESLGPQLWHAHNVVLNRGVQMGFPGMVGFLLLWVALLKAIWPTKDDSPEDYYLKSAAVMVVAATFFKNMTDDYFTRDMVWLFFLLMGMTLARSGSHGKKDSSW